MHATANYRGIMAGIPESLLKSFKIFILKFVIRYKGLRVPTKKQHIPKTGRKKNVLKNYFLVLKLKKLVEWVLHYLSEKAVLVKFYQWLCRINPAEILMALRTKFFQFRKFRFSQKLTRNRGEGEEPKLSVGMIRTGRLNWKTEQLYIPIRTMMLSF